MRYGPPEWNEPWHTVIAVAGNVTNQRLKGQVRWNIYIPASPGYPPSTVILRTASDPLRLAQAARARIVGIDHDIAVSEVYSLVQVLDRAAWRERFVTVLFSVFSVLALLLAAVGTIRSAGVSVSLPLTRLEFAWR